MPLTIGYRPAPVHLGTATLVIGPPLDRRDRGVGSREPHGLSTRTRRRNQPLLIAPASTARTRQRLVVVTRNPSTCARMPALASAASILAPPRGPQRAPSDRAAPRYVRTCLRSSCCSSARASLRTMRVFSAEAGSHEVLRLKPEATGAFRHRRPVRRRGRAGCRFGQLTAAPLRGGEDRHNDEPRVASSRASRYRRSSCARRA